MQFFLLIMADMPTSVGTKWCLEKIDMLRKMTEIKVMMNDIEISYFSGYKTGVSAL